MTPALLLALPTRLAFECVGVLVLVVVVKEGIGRLNGDVVVREGVGFGGWHKSPLFAIPLILHAWS